MDITKTIDIAYQKAKEKNWDNIYVAVDIHDTIVKGNYTTKDIPKEFYPIAKETLQLLSNKKEIKLILYTCSHPEEIKLYLEFFNQHNITFDFVNENTDVMTDLQGYGNYDKKPYFNVLLDDKAGFNPYEDWITIYNHIK